MVRTLVLFVAIVWSCGGRGDEVLPSLSAEKMSEYKNAFGKAISESREQMGRERPAGPPRDSGLSNVSKHLREVLDGKGRGGPPAERGAKGDGPRHGGSDGQRPPPGFGGPGQPGGRPPVKGP